MADDFDDSEEITRFVTLRRVRVCRHREGPFHDCAYVDLRMALIPQAEAIATKLTGDKRSSAWSKEFADAMTRLWRGVAP